MPGKKGKNQIEPEIPPEQEEPEVIDYQKVVDMVTETFDSRFAKMEKVMENLAKAAAPKPAPKGKKRAAPAEPTTYDTRNKALRSKYNPSLAQPSLTNNDSLDENIDELSGEEGDAIEQRAPDVDVRRPPPAQARGRAPGRKSAAVKQNNNKPASRQLDYAANPLAMNNWMLETAGMNNTPRPAAHYPMSTKDAAWDDDLDRRATSVLAAAIPTIAKGNCNNNKPGIFPFKYVYRGADMKRASVNSVSLAEHLWGIFQIIRDNAVDNEIKPYLLIHMEQVLEDSCEYEWATAVRPWSEDIFSRVADGRLIKGWADAQEIQNLRMKISQASTAKIAPPKDTPQGAQQQQKSHQFPNMFEHLRGGPPCVNFNSAKGCLLPSGHLTNGKKLIHICAFCLFNASAARPHSEYYCRNKQRQQPHFQ